MKNKILFLMLGMFLLIGTLGFTSALTWTNVSGYWSFDDGSGTNINDNTTGSLHNGTLVNGNELAWKSGASCKLGGCLDLLASNDYAFFGTTLTDGYNDWNDYGNNFALSFWINRRSFTDAGIITKSIQGNSYGQFTLSGDSNKMYLRLNNSGTVYTNTGSTNINQWDFVVVQYNQSFVNYYINGVFNSTQAVTVNNLANDSSIILGVYFNGGQNANYTIDELGFWNRTLNAIDITELYNSGSGLAYGDASTSILVNITSPSNNSILTSTSNLFNVSLSMTGTNLDYEWANNTYHIWYSNGTTRNVTTITGLSTNSTSTSKLFTLGYGNYLLDSYACYNNATFGNCSWGTSNYSFGINSSINSETHNAVGYETASETYILNLTSPAIPTNAYLVYNGTSYSTTITSSGGSIYTLSKTLQIPTSQIGSNTFYYKWNLSSTFAENTTTYNQYINNTIFGLCNATLTIPYLNITFKDEATNGYINATVPSSTFLYYLGDGSITKTLTYSQTVNQTNYTFCGLPSNQTYHVNPYFQYKLGTDYPQRIWNPDLTDYTNSTTNVTLYLLSSTDGIYVTFQLVNTADQLVSGVAASGTRTINSVLTTIASGTTGNDGSVVFWVNPDFETNFTFIKSGYTTYTTLLIPTQSSYTITLSGETAVTGYDYSRGISYIINPKERDLDNNTIYNFNYTLYSTYWDVENFGFSLRLRNGTVLTSASSATNGGYISVNLNTSNYTRIIMDYYYVTNSTYTNFTTSWYVIDTTYNGWSIRTFFNDLNSYLDSGIFGIDEFGRYVLIFFVIFLSIGVLSYKFGLTSPVVLSAMLFAIIFFFDVVVELLPTPINAIPHSLTFLSALILIVLLIKEAQTG